LIERYEFEGSPQSRIATREVVGCVAIGFGEKNNLIAKFEKGPGIKARVGIQMAASRDWIYEENGFHQLIRGG